MLASQCSTTRDRLQGLLSSKLTLSPQSAGSVSLTSFKVYLRPLCFGALDLCGERPLTCLILSSIERLLWDKTSTPRLTAAAKLLQSCPTLCDPIDGSPPGSPVPGILQAGTLEWVAIAFSRAWKWSRSVMPDSERPHGLQPTRLLRPWDFPGNSTGVGCHCLLWHLG